MTAIVVTDHTAPREQGQERQMSQRKIVGYNVYEAPEGAAETYYGFATSKKTARKLIKGYGLEKSLYGNRAQASYFGVRIARRKTRAMAY